MDAIIFIINRLMLQANQLKDICILTTKNTEKQSKIRQKHRIESISNWNLSDFCILLNAIRKS